MLTAIPLPEIDRIVKRTAFTSIGIGVVGAALAVLLDQQLFALGLGLGLVLAIANHRVFQSSAMRFTTADGVLNRKPFAGSVLLRLGACTAVAFVLLYFVRPMGWGVVVGLALFQAVMLGCSIVALIGFQRRQITDAGSRDA